VGARWAALIPLAMDDVIIASSMSILLASLGANVAVAD
jgi:hypothetical protein